MYFRKKTSGGRAYLQIVESRREGRPAASLALRAVGVALPPTVRQVAEA